MSIAGVPTGRCSGVVLDEFAPFGCRNFPQILQTARGTNTAFLFSMQSLPQLMHVGSDFKEDVTSAPNTTITMRTRDEETASFFLESFRGTPRHAAQPVDGKMEVLRVRTL